MLVMIVIEPGLLALVDARRWRVRPLRDRVVDPDDALVHLDAVQVFLGHFCVIRVLEVDKAVAARTTRFRVDHHLDALDFSVLGENLNDLVLGRRHVQAEHAEAATFGRVFL